MNPLEFLRETTIEDLGLPGDIVRKLQDEKILGLEKIYPALLSYRAIGRCSLGRLTSDEIEALDQSVKGYLALQEASCRAEPAELTGRREEIPDPAPGSLGEWEAFFLPQIKKVELVGEVPISKDELEQISCEFRLLFNRHNTQSAFNAIQKYYPATFLVFMVGQGIYGYNGGDYWLAVRQALGRSIHQQSYGELFENLLDRFGKPQFPNLRSQSFRFVSLILAHGGVPVYCLKDFFSNIVFNCAARPQLMALEGEELVEEVLQSASYTISTDRPVLHFLEYGGSTAADLLDRSRTLLFIWEQEQKLLTADEVGLPAHITEFFSQWVNENTSLLLERGPKNRLKRPVLSLDPWGLGVFLTLPSQPVSNRQAKSLLWIIETGDYCEEIKARTQRKGEQVETREITVRLPEIAEKIKIQFGQGDSIFEWTITGYSSNHLILAFDPASGHIQNHILARETWLMYPQNLSLSIQTGVGALLEVLPELPGEWSIFRLECWDLSQAVTLSLREGDQLFREIYIRSSEKVKQPYLDGGNLVPTDLDEDPVPLYTGKPPILKIPLPGMQENQAELGRWRIRLENVDDATPSELQETTLAFLPDTVCMIVDNTVHISLEAPVFLGARPRGTYKITLKGPLGRDATLYLKILPEFSVCGLKVLYIPDGGQRPSPVTFSIQTGIMDHLEPLGNTDGIEIETERPGSHIVHVPGGLCSVKLLLRGEEIHRQFYNIPVCLRIKRLRWRLVFGGGLVQNWFYEQASCSIQELLQEVSPLLIVDLPENEDGNYDLQLELRDFQDRIIQKLTPSGSSTKRAKRFWRFDLSRIKHSLMMNDSPVFRLRLLGRKGSGENTELDLPVLTFTQEIQVSRLGAETYSSLEQFHVLVTWQEEKRLRSRALILWALFQPWQPPIMELIPDAACGEYEFSISRKDFVEGVYRAQMVIVDPWVSSPPPALPPKPGLANCFDVEISSPQERLKRLSRDLLSGKNSEKAQFHLRMENAFILQYLGKNPDSILQVELCCKLLFAASARELFVLKELITQVESCDVEKVFGERILHPIILERLYKGLIQSELTEDELTIIFQSIPHSENWSLQTCESMIKIDQLEFRAYALSRLVEINPEKAVDRIIHLIGDGKLSIEDAVELLLDEKSYAIGELKKYPVIQAKQLIELLTLYNPYSGMPVVQSGSWVYTNAGWGRIEQILDPITRLSVDSFIEGSGKYILSVRLHIHISYDFSGENALIHMDAGTITFPRASRVFVCPYCQEFATAKLEMYRSHMTASHGNATVLPGQKGNVIKLTSIEFSSKPRQNTKES